MTLTEWKLGLCRAALKAVDELWSLDNGKFTLDYGQEVKMETPLGRVWRAVRISLEETR